MTFLEWDIYFIKIAELVSQKSKDPNTKVGAVIVGPDHEIRSTGYNGFPRKVLEDRKRWERPQKYMYVAHAELNSILNAARHGVALKDCSIYLNFEPIPCNECAKAIINVGIKNVIGPNRPFLGTNWTESLVVSKNMLDEAGIKRITVFDID